MIKLYTREEAKQYFHNNKTYSILTDLIFEDLNIIENCLSFEYQGRKEFRSHISILTNKEFLELDKYEPIIDKTMFEYTEYHIIQNQYVIEKSLYLFANGESGIILYIVHEIDNNDKRFKNNIFITSNAMKTIPIEVIVKMIELLEIAKIRLKDKLDYLQVFRIKRTTYNNKKCLEIIHTQEKPDYEYRTFIELVNIEDSKIYWISEYDIDGNEYSTILMAEDY